MYDDETTDAIRALFDQVIDEGAIVAALWWMNLGEKKLKCSLDANFYGLDEFRGKHMAHIGTR